MTHREKQTSETSQKFKSLRPTPLSMHTKDDLLVMSAQSNLGETVPSPHKDSINALASQLKQINQSSFR